MDLPHWEHLHWGEHTISSSYNRYLSMSQQHILSPTWSQLTSTPAPIFRATPVHLGPVKKIKSCVFVLLLVYCLFIPPSRKNKVWIEYEGTRENIPQMFCTYIRIEWKILVFRKTAFHTFPKSVYPTPLLTLKQRLNGAQTQAVFLYFSILN